MSEKLPQNSDISQKDLELAKELRNEYLETRSLFLKATENKDQELRQSLLNKAKKLRDRILSLEKGEGDITTESIIQIEYTNPEGKTETIEIDIEKEIKEQIQFYKDEDIDIPPDFEDQIRDLWNNNQEQIKEAIEKQGFDFPLLIPPYDTQDINKKTTKDYNDTFQGIQISDITDTKPNQTRIVLVRKKDAQDLERPELKQTKGKSIYDLCNATTDQEKAQIDELIKTNKPLPIEGLTFGEYLILDRQYFKETGKHLDEDTWTWLPQSTRGTSVGYSLWNPGNSQVAVSASSPGFSDSHRGVRPSRTIL